MEGKALGGSCAGLPEGSYVFHDLMISVRTLLEITKSKKLTGYAVLVRKDREDLRRDPWLGVIFLQEGLPSLVRLQDSPLPDSADLATLEKATDVWVLDLHLLPKETVERVRRQIHLDQRVDVSVDFEARDIVV